MEKVSGQKYEDFVKKEILEKLQMKRSTISRTELEKMEYNFIVLMVRDIFIPRGKLGALELSIRRKIDIIVHASTRNKQPVRRKKKRNNRH